MHHLYEIIKLDGFITYTVPDQCMCNKQAADLAGREFCVEIKSAVHVHALGYPVCDTIRKTFICWGGGG